MCIQYKLKDEKNLKRDAKRVWILFSYVGFGGGKNSYNLSNKEFLILQDEPTRKANRRRQSSVSKDRGKIHERPQTEESKSEDSSIYGRDGYGNERMSEQQKTGKRQERRCRGKKRGRGFRSDAKSLELIKHLQFQQWFMNPQHGKVEDQPRELSLLTPPAAPDRESGDQPSSTPINLKEEDPPELQNLLKIHSCHSKTRPDALLVLPEALEVDSPPNVLVSCCQTVQQKRQKPQQRNLQSILQKSESLNLTGQKLLLAPKSNSERHKSDNQNIFTKNSEKGLLPKKRKPQKNYSYGEDDDSQAVESFKFPFVNEYLKQHGDEYLRTLQTFDKTRQKLRKTINDTFINCDVRYFNWKHFTEEVGKFQVVLIDPPWRIKGAQQNDSQFMFSNCRFSLQYNTMANSEIGRIPLHLLSDQGFIFLWILNSQLDASLEIMEGWGYELVEELVWVKLKDEKINLTHGYYFMHSYEVCLVGYKCKKGEDQQKLKVRKGISWNAVFAQVREKSQKPEDLYGLIDIMFKGGRKIQIFARNHNLRFGIFSIGNELGESYDKWLLRLSCDECGDTLVSGSKRYKSKLKPNYDLCQKCIALKDKTQFFQLSNNVDENIKHEYISCNHCGSEPIWGIRFQCITCHDFDICENCYDKNLHLETNFHPLDHQFFFLQIPVFGNGFHIHESKCSSCYQNPIIGIYFSCATCKSLNLCQKCYFQRPASSFASLMKRHKPDHQLQVVFQSQMLEDKRYQCFSCKTQILEHCWMCENCYNFFFCEKCFQSRTDFKSLYANTHKKYHVLTKIF